MSAALLVFLALLVGGAIPVDSPSAPADTSAEAFEAPPAPATTERRTTERQTTATAPAATTATAVGPTVVVLTAARGESWFSARLGSESGTVLDERVLALGESVRLEGRRIWLSIGAAGNVEITVDGKPRELAPGTVSMLLTPSI